MPCTNKARIRRWAVLLVAAAVTLHIWPATLRAQGTLISPWFNYTQEDGLASNNVLVVTVGEGEVWFGTDNGISRFDGAWRSWSEHSDLRSGVQSLTIGDSGAELWAGTSSGAVLIWDGAAWERLTELDAPVRALHYSQGQLWIGTEDGLYIWISGSPASVAGFDDASVNVIGSSDGGSGIWVGTSEGLWLRQSSRLRAPSVRRTVCPVLR